MLNKKIVYLKILDYEFTDSLRDENKSSVAVSDKTDR